jgi:hypothetical protein
MKWPRLLRPSLPSEATAFIAQLSLTSSDVLDECTAPTVEHVRHDLLRLLHVDDAVVVHGFATVVQHLAVVALALDVAAQAEFEANFVSKE